MTVGTRSPTTTARKSQREPNTRYLGSPLYNPPTERTATKAGHRGSGSQLCGQCRAPFSIRCTYLPPELCKRPVTSLVRAGGGAHSPVSLLRRRVQEGAHPGPAPPPEASVSGRPSLFNLFDDTPQPLLRR